jgi:hypothetical protein
MFFVLKSELILIIDSNNVLMEGARKVYRGRRVGQGWSKVYKLYKLSRPQFIQQILRHNPLGLILHEASYWYCYNFNFVSDDVITVADISQLYITNFKTCKMGFFER